MTIKYIFAHQYHSINGIFFIEKSLLTIEEFRLYLTTKHKLNMSDYNIFQKKKKLNADYIFFRDSFVMIFEKCKLSPNERRKFILTTRKML